jgi:hypothetical protein
MPPAPVDDLGEVVQSVLIKGDLSKLTPQERVNYYTAVCRSIGLNPLTQPFDYIWLSGKLTLYARKDCTDQLRKLHDISVELFDSQFKDGILSVRAKARMGDRTDEDIGAVSLPDRIQGDIRANLIMKCSTKAKRRVTLSICGLGFLDETEIETIPGARVEPNQVVQSKAPDEVPSTFPGDRKEAKDGSPSRSKQS